MRAIDQHAWTNRWRNWHPAEKLLPAGGLLILTLILPPLTTAPLVLAGMALTTVRGAGVPLRTLSSAGAGQFTASSVERMTAEARVTAKNGR